MVGILRVRVGTDGADGYVDGGRGTGLGTWGDGRRRGGSDGNASVSYRR